jgi:hypothetical protein
VSDRLTDEQVARAARLTYDGQGVIALAREVQEYRALRPTCLTCDGQMCVMNPNFPHYADPCPDCEDGKMPLADWVKLQAATAKSIDQLLGGHTITERLAEGWYPSRRDPDTGAVRHDRHVMIWLRNYEALLRQASAVLKMAGESQ